MKTLNITLTDLKAIELALSKFIPYCTEEKENADESLRKVKLLVDSVKEGTTDVIRTSVEDKPSVRIVGILPNNVNLYRTAWTQKEACRIYNELYDMGCKQVLQCLADIRLLPED